MKTIRGPAIFLAQFASDTAPFNNLKNLASWASRLGYKGVQLPSWDARVMDLKLAAESKTYCDEIRGTLAAQGLELTELSTHLQGQRGPLSSCSTPRRPPQILASLLTSRFPARWPGPTCTRGHRDLRG